MKRKYSFIIPVYNRPDEIKELLESFRQQQSSLEYEIIIVEDGSTRTAEHLISNYNQLPITYFYKNNTGPGDSRNYGMQRATGNYFIILDSDCILPPTYFQKLQQFLEDSFFHCFGGPDAARSDFSTLQKAINYTMTSFLTTGGIRGNKNQIQKYEPRSFNMGLSQEAFEATQGFGDIHPGEDPDLVQRLLKKNYTIGYAPEVYVYHKRRISWKQFYTQVKKFGTVRAILNRWHPNTRKLTFWFPTIFLIFSILSVLLLFFNIYILALLLAIYLLVIGIDSSVKNQSIVIGFLSILGVFIQFYGYGLAFFNAYLKIHLLNQDPRKRFPSYFFNKKT